MKANRQQKTVATVITATLLSLGLTSYALAAADYERLKKDINVMMGIVKSAFETSEDCKRCRISISGHYLADQGVVFDVSTETTARFLALDGDHDFEIHTEGFIGAIPDVVHEILEDVDITFDGAIDGKDVHTRIITDGNWTELNDEVREQLRETRIQVRELSREMRELQIESINAEEAQRKEIEARQRELEAEMAEINEREHELEENVQVVIQRRQAERETRAAKRREEQQRRFSKIEKVVLDSFCDYSRTIRSLPKGERISIVMKQASEPSKIYVLEKDEIDSCDSAKTDLRKSALSYAF